MNASLYDTDFYTWTAQQCELLRHKKFHELDLGHLIEELDDLGKRHYDQLESRLVQLIAHLLKWQIQHWRRSNSWRANIRVQRTSIEKLLRRNPGLKSRLDEAMAESWSEARDLAIAETDLPDEQFPEICPFTLVEVLLPEFWPDLA
ncbi:hypothetical protein AWQ21_10230 [Picosynechococcus sp. PCC 7003]|uniref:DUF29 domain-containing protein n=1 Tax=Picosynechococcus sp. PCC 7003 TaxID=374981 RepID=UPI000810E6A9|nr:DUF29 domain-containing protein [Picosynechococcus sp. PCC 7003]ANV84724.1 hypothetical protein AWQ21_10230 [Picosynechococcus sp. PCC 7003]